VDAVKQDDAVVPESPEPRWLEGVERDAWLSLIGVIIRLPASLDTQLQRDAGLSHFEYIVMVNLSNADGHVLRMSQLAALCHSSLSRLSHVVARLERRSWLRRDPCPDDGRATLATLTDEGFAKLASAAPGHVEAVREYVIDALDPQQLRPAHRHRRDDPGPPGRRHAAPVERTMPLVTTAPSMRATTRCQQPSSATATP
jgi:DNA-binding MarR family transcriptional regulator